MGSPRKAKPKGDDSVDDGGLLAKARALAAAATQMADTMNELPEIKMPNLSMLDSLDFPSASENKEKSKKDLEWERYKRENWDENGEIKKVKKSSSSKVQNKPHPPQQQQPQPLSLSQESLKYVQPKQSPKKSIRSPVRSHCPPSSSSTVGTTLASNGMKLAHNKFSQINTRLPPVQLHDDSKIGEAIVPLLSMPDITQNTTYVSSRDIDGAEGYSARMGRNNQTENYHALVAQRAAARKKQEKMKKDHEEARILQQIQLKKDKMRVKAAELRKKTERRLAEYKTKQNEDKNLVIETPSSPRPRRPPLDMKNFPANPNTARNNTTVEEGEDKRPISTSRRATYDGEYVYSNSKRPEGVGSPQREAEERVREKKRKELEAAYRRKKEEERKAAAVAAEMARKAEELRRRTEERVAYYKKNKAAIEKETRRAQAEVEEEKQEREKNYLKIREEKTKQFRKQTLHRMKQRQAEAEEKLKQEERMKQERLQQRVNYIRAHSVHDAHRRPPKSAGASLITPSSSGRHDDSIASYEQPSLFKRSTSDAELDIQSRISGGGKSASRYNNQAVIRSIEHEDDHGSMNRDGGYSSAYMNNYVNNNNFEETENNSGSNHDIDSNDRNIIQFTGGRNAKKEQSMNVPTFEVNNFRSDGSDDEGDEFEIRDSLDVKPSSKIAPPTSRNFHSPQKQRQVQQQGGYESFDTDDISCMTGDETAHWKDSTPDDRSAASGRKKWGEPEALRIKGQKKMKKNPVWKKLAPIPVRAYVQAPVKNEPHSRF